MWSGSGCVVRLMLQSKEENEDDRDIDEKESRDDSVDALCLSCTILFECFSIMYGLWYELVDSLSVVPVSNCGLPGGSLLGLWPGKRLPGTIWWRSKI